MSSRNIPGGKGGRCVTLTTSPPSGAECHEIWEPKPPGTLWATPGLLYTMPLQRQKLYGFQLRTKDQYKHKTGMNLGEGQEKERGKQLRESTKIATIQPSLELGARYKSTESSLPLGHAV
jgi:hypothetical protein